MTDLTRATGVSLRMLKHLDETGVLEPSLHPRGHDHTTGVARYSDVDLLALRAVVAGWPIGSGGRDNMGRKRLRVVRRLAVVGVRSGPERRWLIVVGDVAAGTAGDGDLADILAKAAGDRAATVTVIDLDRLRDPAR